MNTLDRVLVISVTTLGLSLATQSFGRVEMWRGGGRCE